MVRRKKVRQEFMFRCGYGDNEKNMGLKERGVNEWLDKGEDREKERGVN